MRKAGIALVWATAALAQEQVVQRAGIWMDTVKHGDIPLMVRGLGVLGAGNTAELKMPDDIMKQVEAGQKASVITTEQAVIEGKVARVGSGVVILELDGALPATAHPGTPVDGTIQTGNLSAVEYVGRPVHCRLDGEEHHFQTGPGRPTRNAGEGALRQGLGEFSGSAQRAPGGRSSHIDRYVGV